MSKTSTLCPVCFKGTVDTSQRRSIKNCSHCKSPCYVLTESRAICNIKRMMLKKHGKAKKSKSVVKNSLLTGVAYRKIEVSKRKVPKKNKNRR